jgi:hypothetical protein
VELGAPAFLDAGNVWKASCLCRRWPSIHYHRLAELGEQWWSLAGHSLAKRGRGAADSSKGLATIAKTTPHLCSCTIRTTAAEPLAASRDSQQLSIGVDGVQGLSCTDRDERHLGIWAPLNGAPEEVGFIVACSTTFLLMNKVGIHNSMNRTIFER